MIISEMISQLEKIKEKYGDLPVLMEAHEDEYYFFDVDNFSIREIDYTSDEDTIDRKIQEVVIMDYR